MKEIKPKLAGSLNKYGFAQADNVLDANGISPTIITGGNQIGHQINIYAEDKDMGKLRIRKLTEGECMRLMGFDEKDTQACKEAGLSKANIYHQSGDSIVSTVICGLFGELIGSDYRKKIEDYCDKLHGEVE